MKMFLLISVMIAIMLGGCATNQGQAIAPSCIDQRANAMERLGLGMEDLYPSDCPHQ